MPGEQNVPILQNATELNHWTHSWCLENLTPAGVGKYCRAVVWSCPRMWASEFCFLSFWWYFLWGPYSSFIPYGFQNRARPLITNEYISVFWLLCGSSLWLCMFWNPGLEWVCDHEAIKESQHLLSRIDLKPSQNDEERINTAVWEEERWAGSWLWSLGTRPSHKITCSISWLDFTPPTKPACYLTE